METPDDPVDAWRGLRGSRELRDLIGAGERLCDALERIRVAWRQAVAERRADIARLDERVAELAAQLTATNEPSALDVEVRAWHEREHADGWAVCPHPVCRAAD